MVQTLLKVGVKKAALYLFVSSLVACAIAAISIFVFGDFKSSFSGKILGTTFIIMIFSLTGLCNATLIEKKTNPVMGWIGLIMSGLAAFFPISIIWEFIDESDDLTQTILACVVLAVAIAYASLLQLVQPRQKALLWMRRLTQACIGGVAAIVLMLIYEYITTKSEIIMRALGVLAVLGVLGTILLPILKKRAANPPENS